MVIFFAHFFGSHWKNELRMFFPPQRGRWLIAICVAFLADQLAGFWLATAFPDALAEETKGLRDELFSPSTTLLVIVSACLFAPAAEEMLFRGFLLPSLANTRIGFWGASLATSAWWSMIHDYSWPGTASIFVSGLFLSYILWRTGSILPCIGAHAFSNVVALSFLALDL